METSTKSKKYSKIKRYLSTASFIITGSALAYFTFSSASEKLKVFVLNFTSNEYLAFTFFTFILFSSISILVFPISFYSGYILEHQYGLSNQSLSKYFVNQLKGMLLSITIGIPVLLIFFFILKNTGDLWWLWFSGFMILFSVVLGKLAPVLLFPLFYKFKPLENDEINKEIKAICEEANVNVNGIYSFNMSKDTKKANAAFTGMGKTKRIILGDTLLSSFSLKEILTVFAHELGHYNRMHIVKLSFVSSAVTIASFWSASIIYNVLLRSMGYTSQYDIAALPLLIILLSAISFITSPLMNILSRKFEYEADAYALKITRDKDAFISTMEKLAEQNLADKSPNAIIEFLFHSHPSIEKRINFAKSYEY